MVEHGVEGVDLLAVERAAVVVADRLRARRGRRRSRLRSRSPAVARRGRTALLRSTARQRRAGGQLEPLQRLDGPLGVELVGRESRRSRRGAGAVRTRRSGRAPYAEGRFALTEEGRQLQHVLDAAELLAGGAGGGSRRNPARRSSASTRSRFSSSRWSRVRRCRSACSWPARSPRRALTTASTSVAAASAAASQPVAVMASRPLCRPRARARSAPAARPDRRRPACHT